MPGTNITNRVRALRLECGGLTQQQLAERVSVTRQTIIAIEKSRYAPSLELAFRIARTLRTPLEQVFQYTDPPAPARGRQELS